MRDDLELLREHSDDLQSLIDGIELELVDDARWEEPSNTSYLNAKDRANPDIMANVEAMSATNELIDWFGKDMEGFVGLWRGPESTPIEDALVVRLDTEGQYELVARTVGDYLLVTADEDAFDDHHEALVEAGFEVAPSIKAIHKSIKARRAPNEHRDGLYEAAKAVAKTKAKSTATRTETKPAEAAKTPKKATAKKRG